MFKTEAEPGLNGRSLSYPRGKVIGGSSAINAMIYMRGQAADYDHWRQLGLSGWGWSDVLPLFRKQTDHFLGESEYHGVGGEWRIEEPRGHLEAARFCSRSRRAAIRHPADRGLQSAATMKVFGLAFTSTKQKGRRWSSARASSNRC